VVVIGIVWLGTSLVAALTMTYIQLGWWLGHGLELDGILAVGAAVALDLARSVQSRPLAGDLHASDLVLAEEAFLGSHVRALTLSLAQRDDYTEQHTRRVALRAVQVGELLGLSPSRLRAVIKRHPDQGKLLDEVGEGLRFRGGVQRDLQRLLERDADLGRAGDRLDLPALHLEHLLPEKRESLLVDEDGADRVLRPDGPGDVQDLVLDLAADDRLGDLHLDLQRAPLVADDGRAAHDLGDGLRPHGRDRIQGRKRKRQHACGNHHDPPRHGLKVAELAVAD
jgi:hypothetical protein